MNAQPRAEILRSLATLAAVILIYYALPVGERPSNQALVLGVAGLLIGTGALGWLIIRQVRRQIDEGEQTFIRVQSLMLLVYLAVLLFAVGYYILERADAAQFEGLETKTDALYFTLSTLGTVGFGDVHATGQLARVIVTIHIAFNLVFVGTLVTVLTARVRRNVGIQRR